jgi:hypothetical protein
MSAVVQDFEACVREFRCEASSDRDRYDAIVPSPHEQCWGVDLAITLRQLRDIVRHDLAADVKESPDTVGAVQGVGICCDLII